MAQATITKCDFPNCPTVTTTPSLEKWQRLSLFPAEAQVLRTSNSDDGSLLLDICPACAAKLRNWLVDKTVSVVFRKKREKAAS